ncbi:MAG: TonB-dependent receptor [Chitinophagaceae bacterium]|nr:TonB-dependent receptor [Chitinophagaceae bacterium]
MKKIYSLFLFAAIGGSAFSQSGIKKNDTLLLQPIEIKAVRAADKSPFTKTNLGKKEIEKLNLGQDLPYLLNQIPSVVVSSDAGNGVGYTYIHIRGTDAARINVTLNGIPYNDAESQGTFFVDLPDISSSVSSIQVQRGVGTSSNGSGAFGASINLSTNEINDSAYAESNNSYGSFYTWKNTLKAGTGLLKNHFTVDARISKISSDGYIDRAASNLKSFYVSTAYLDAKNSLRLNILSGKEKTYQAWYGVPESYLDSNRTFNPAGTEKPGEPYSNETDNYTQTHYQLFFNHKIHPGLGFTMAVFLTKGAGYYEEYRAAQTYADYGLPAYHNGPDTIFETDLVRRLWLHNNFYGTVFSLQYQHGKTQATLGGGWDKYDGKHFGIVTWAPQGFPSNYRYYDHEAHKSEVNIYTKVQQQLGTHLQAFGDIQLRNVKYDLNGFENNPDLNISKNYLFINPKLGITYYKNKWQTYISGSVGSKEPNRDDFEAGKTQQPLPEFLYDAEFGTEKTTRNYSFGATLYYMLYRNQLVLTGKINDVGAYTRTNTPSSYRAGIELQGRINFDKHINMTANFAMSKNKIKTFTEYLDDYDAGDQKQFQYHNSDISFSPGNVGSAALNFFPAKNLEVNFISKYVGRQFLDNTSNPSRSINNYFIENAQVNYLIRSKLPREINLVFQVNNIFNKKYEANGYTYNYVTGGNIANENYYFPMALRNFMASVNVRL